MSAAFDLDSTGTGRDDDSSSDSSSDSEPDSENDDSEEEREKRLKELQEQVGHLPTSQCCTIHFRSHFSYLIS